MRPTLLLLLLLALFGAALSEDGPSPPPAAASEDDGEEEGEAAAVEASEASSAEEVEDAEAAEEAVEVEAMEEPVAAAAAEAPAAARAGSSASVQWVVTQKMKAQLSALGYAEAEIMKLDAERAAAIIRRSISRPAAGVPAGWNRGASKPRPGLRSAIGVIRKPFAAIGLPAGAVNAVLGVAALSIGYGLFPKGGGGGSAAVKRALAPELPAEVEADTVPAPAKPKSDELWLDVQIDKFIDFLKGLVGK